MLKIRAWVMLMAMCALVFSLSGCGGGSLDGNVSEDGTSDTIPNNDPDSYNTAQVLAGEWSVLNDTIDTINLTRNLYDIQMRMISARMNLADVIVSGDGGSLSITDSKQEWYVLITSPIYHREYVPYVDENGNITYRYEITTVYEYTNNTVLSSLNSSVLMTHAGKNKWRFEFIRDESEINEQATAMSIEITSPTTMHVKQQDIVTISSDNAFKVFSETEFDMRKVSGTN